MVSLRLPTIDRIEGQTTRTKVEVIQTRFCEIERLHILKTRPHGQLHFSKMLLLLSKLRALDALSTSICGPDECDRCVVLFSR